MATWSHELYRIQWQEHVGRTAVHTVSDQGGCGRDMWHASGFVHILFFLGYQVIQWCCSLWRCVSPPQLLPHVLIVSETSPHIHPAMPFISPGHLSIQYTDKTSRLEFHSSREVTHPLANRGGEQVKSWLVGAAQARCTTNLETTWDCSFWLHRLMSGPSRT